VFDSRFWALLTVGLLAAPILAAVWSHPWFVTQDGSIYLYNAHIILESLKPGNAFRDYYSVRWVPLPYWIVYVLLGGLMSVFPDRIADHLIVSLTSVGFLACLLWLRWKVAGWDGMALVAGLAVIFSISLLWLLGMYNFLFGAGCYLITLGLWWSRRDDLGPKQGLLVAGLLVVGYLCHPVSAGATAFALIVLSLATQGPGRRRRVAWTIASILPLIPLMSFYRSLMQGAAATHPRWENLTNPLSAGQWLSYFQGANVLVLADDEPNLFFSHTISGWSHLPAATTWTIAALILLSLSAVIRWKSQKSPVSNKTRAWILVSAPLIFCGLFGPDDLGKAHGGFLRERLLLLGLATLASILKPCLTRARAQAIPAALGFGALLIACSIQLAAVWNYAETSNRLAAELMQAKSYIGTGQRVAVLIDEPEDNYAAKPLLHVCDLLGIDTGNVIWNNYAPGLYYFPIRFRDPTNAALLPGPVFPEFTDPEIRQKDIEDWTDLLSKIEARTDVLVVWGGDRELDEVNSEWFGDDPVFENEDVRVFRHQ
jgi:hypothetical protein